MRITPIQTQTTDNTSRAKKAAAGVGTAALATGGLIYLAKTGRLDKNEGGNLIKEGVKAVLRTPAKFLEKQADKVADKTSAFVSNHPKLDAKLTNAKTFVTTKYQAAKKFLGDTVDTVKSKFGKKAEAEAASDVAIA